MSNNLYEEAINAADQIKEAAENRVKQQLIEAMTPKIKKIIQEKYLDENDIEYTMETDDEYGEGTEIHELDDECGEGVEESDDESYLETDESSLEISNESVNIIKKMIQNKNEKNNIEKRLDTIREGINHLKKAMILAENNNNSYKLKRKFVYAYKNLLQELKNIKSSSIIKTDKTLLKEFLQLSKELNNMTRRRSRSRYLNENLEELLEMNLFEEEGDDQMEDMPSMDDSAKDTGDSDSDGMMVPDEVASMTLKQLVDAVDDSSSGAADMRSDDDLEIELDDEEDDDDEMLDAGDDEGADEEGFYFEGIAEDDEGADCEDEDPNQDDNSKSQKEMSEGLFLEIDENMLKREIKNMRRLREGEAKDMAHHFGGGSVDKEMFTEFDESDLNVHADKLGREGVPVPTVEAALRNAVRKNRIAESKNKQYRNALRGMKKQLSEMNLFNAKLLYANKLMQNRDLSIKQQKHIVESLDEAGTLNEAKLLFESLSKSLSRPTRKSGNLNESSNRRVLGSSSRSVRSAQPMNESVALDRWATLAGIKK